MSDCCVKGFVIHGDKNGCFALFVNLCICSNCEYIQVYLFLIKTTIDLVRDK